ncbi:MAG: HPr family phosphocarrier protein [Nitrospinota bacterium]
MQRVEVEIIHPLGLHARSAFILSGISDMFKSIVTLHHNGLSGNGKEVMDILALGACHGSTIVIETIGEDEDAALVSLTRFFQDYK